MNKFSITILIILTFYCNTTGVKNPESYNEKNTATEESPTNRFMVMEENLQKASSLEEKQKLTLQYSEELILGKKYEEATKILKNYISKNRSDVQATFLLSKSLYQSGNYTESMKYLQQCKSLDKGYNKFERDRLIARVHFKMSNYGPGIRVLGEASQDKRFEKDQEFYEMAARGFKEINMCKRSLQIASEGLNKYPKNHTLNQIKLECSEL